MSKSDIDRVIEYLDEDHRESPHLYDVWKRIPTGWNIRKILPQNKNDIGERILEVNGLRFKETLRVDHIVAYLKAENMRQYIEFKQRSEKYYGGNKEI